MFVVGSAHKKHGREAGVFLPALFHTSGTFGGIL
jgi:hypothetical protein